jgi:phosphatidate phosphatase APP1
MYIKMAILNKQKLRTSILKKVNILDDKFDNLKFKVRKKLGRIGPIWIQPYKGYGNSQALYLKGRVLKDRNIRPAQESDSAWSNLKAMVKRFNSSELPGVSVKATYLDVEKTAVTDKEGYYEMTLTLKAPLPRKTFWIDVDLELLENIHPGQGPVVAKGQVMVTEGNSEFGVISDVDDTILTTDATNLWRMLKLTFLNNARTRLPFAGVAAFYQALQKGSNGTQNNPLFYVSSSPWNLYDLLIDFCNVHEIPTGPFMLRDFGIDETKFFTSKHLNHKTNEIEKIMSFYKNLDFILIGDSGQHDPEIYLQVIKDFPGRVKVIYIRDVTHEARRIQVNAIAEEMKQNHGVEMLLVKDTEEAARHAAGLNYIDPENIPDIIQEKIEDNNAPSDLEQLIGFS